MKLFIVIAVLIAVSTAAPNYDLIHENLPSYAAPIAVEEVRIFQHIPIIKFSLDSDNYGTFALETVSGDGSTFVKNGQLKNLGDPEGPVSVMSGSYSFVEGGQTYTVHYTADENGFRATGDHLPVPPPLL